MSPNMTRRHGPVIKTIIVVAVLLCSIYFIYVYNNVSGKLKETERVAERYRREQESLRTQLQDLSSAKDDLQQRCENEKKEFVNRLNTLNQHHKMLKSQHDDLEADYARLQSEREKMKNDVKLQDEQRNQEYMQLKQEKDLEISSLKDQVANLGREKSELDQHVLRLSSQLKDSQKIQEQMRTQQSDITEKALTLKNQLGLERTARLNLENQLEQVKKENLHYQGSVNFLQQELFTLQEQVKRQQIQLMQHEQAQKDTQGRAQGQQPQGVAQHVNQGQNVFNNQDNPAHENVNQVNLNPNIGNQGQGHPLVDANVVNQGSLGRRRGINQGVAVKVNRFNQGSRVRTGDINGLHHGDKMDSRVIDQQQQQHQVQPPNLNQLLQKKRDEFKPEEGAALGWHDNKEIESARHKQKLLDDRLRREKELEFEKAKREHDGNIDENENDKEPLDEDEKANDYDDDYDKDGDEDTDNNKNNPGFAAVNDMPNA